VLIKELLKRQKKKGKLEEDGQEYLRRFKNRITNTPSPDKRGAYSKQSTAVAPSPSILTRSSKTSLFHRSPTKFPSRAFSFSRKSKQSTLNMSNEKDGLEKFYK